MCPRRFGKTLNMSMLKYFFDIQQKEENRKLFNNLFIENSKYISEQGKYPIIFLSFKDLKAKNWENSIFKLKNQLKDLYKEFLYLKGSLDEISQEDFNKIIYER
ncbi:AAA family ATPase [Fusobacterium simiae]|uniref:AAA family ATPase n=1 Tax=Fusobacterium simiae TaxID=855 RepID=A0ABT4DID1_FUSSI|nr:AAA family ATPase [Fusobacterium simiae]MCY7008351.1 AAA family ATPase [Fusobacterium simiae]